MKDLKIENLIKKEKRRQKKVINLIASENFVSEETLKALGSVFVNKYAEGYPQKRYYGGTEFVDELEILCQNRALELFGLDRKKWSANVQPYSGSPANLAVFLALVPQGGKIMGMSLEMGGHLTHGQKVSITGKFWKQVSYGVDKNTERLDYRKILEIAKKEKPAIIVAGATAYSRGIDFGKFREIADSVGAYLLADISHISGLVAVGEHPSPFYGKKGMLLADVVMTTTHKTLRGPRGAMIFSREALSSKIDKAVFPGIQGGPHINQIAAMAVALREASHPSFKKYVRQVVKNSKALSAELKRLGWRIVSGGTDNHLFLLDTWEKGIGGGDAQIKLEKRGIIVNKNTIPYDTRKPNNPSGIRLGSPAVTTLGMKEKDMIKIAQKMDKILTS